MTKFPNLVLFLLSIHLVYSPTLSAAKQEISSAKDVPHFGNALSRQANIDWRYASKCKGIIVPPALCTACRMRKFDKKGNFKNNRDIYNLNTWKCQSGLRLYTKLNPCDRPRVEQVKNFYKSWEARRNMGEFMYNICETCCDCIPKGARAWHYKWRKNIKNALILVYRGNCPAHVYYDTCRMWPNIRDVVPLGKKPNTKLSKVCEKEVNPWFRSKLSTNWPNTARSKIPSQRLVGFLKSFTEALKCTNKIVWKECARLEFAQKRI